MSTITTIQSSDLITNSRAVINTNFSNLNSDKIETSYLDTDTTMAANSDVKIASQKAVKTYIDTQGGANASETVRGVVEEATDAETLAGTATGATGAKLAITPAKLKAILAPITRVYTSNDTWSKPTGLKYVEVEVQAGGGGGGASAVTGGSGGGGGGGYSWKRIAVADLGSTETVTVGAGGTAGSASNGGAGGASVFGAHATTTGGSGGVQAVGGAGGAGGAGSSGTLNRTGQTGATGIATRGGEGGSSPLGFGGASPGTSGGLNGISYGGGGSGSGNTSNNGGVGAAGVVIVTEYYV